MRRVTQRRANYSVWTVDQTLRLREGMHQEEKEGGWGALGVRGMGPFVLRLGQLFAGPIPCSPVPGPCREIQFLLRAQDSDSLCTGNDPSACNPPTRYYAARRAARGAHGALRAGTERTSPNGLCGS